MMPDPALDRYFVPEEQPSRMTGGVGPKLWTTNAHYHAMVCLTCGSANVRAAYHFPRLTFLHRHLQGVLLASFVTGLLLGAAVARL